MLHQNIPYIRIFSSSCSGDSETAAAQMSAEGYRHPRGGVRELGVQSEVPSVTCTREVGSGIPLLGHSSTAWMTEMDLGACVVFLEWERCFS